MTAKRRPRGKLARLDTLEAAASVRRAAVEAAKDETWGQVFARMGSADRQAVNAMCECQEENGPLWAEVRRLMGLATGPPLAHPVTEAVWEWEDRHTNTPDGQPWPVPSDPHGFAAYFEAEAARAGTVGTCYALAPALLTGARWAAAWWRTDAVLCRVMGGI